MVTETVGWPQTMVARSGKHPEAKAERILTTWAVSGGLPRDLKKHNCSAREDFRDKIIHLLLFWRGSAACAKRNKQVSDEVNSRTRDQFPSSWVHLLLAPEP